MARKLALAALIVFCLGRPALSDDEGNGAAEKPAPALPNVYLDWRTGYGTVPAGALSIGFGNIGLAPTLQQIQSLAAANALPMPPGGLTSPASQSVGVDLPLTVDVTDHISLYGGISASSTRTDITDWSALAVNSWNLGFQVDVYQQNGGSFPTVTLQTTVTRAVPNGPLATTSLNNILEFSYAFDEDETRGLLAGVQHTRTDIEAQLARIGSNAIGYVGGYYQWPNNWKVTGRLGVQSFGGAQLLSLTPIQSFTQPIVRLDLDRMDDNDNRLFGVTAQISWLPKPSYQLTLRTPLYFVRN
ncbi:hypothetical protein [Bradyrhizobium genosp. P]|uniref:hypothetical protein n=1 Tax=Bradyrhizobium genosp. P TaxID=83641 RepID=UPI003CF11986